MRSHTHLLPYHPVRYLYYCSSTLYSTGTSLTIRTKHVSRRGVTSTGGRRKWDIFPTAHVSLCAVSPEFPRASDSLQHCVMIHRCAECLGALPCHSLVESRPRRNFNSSIFQVHSHRRCQRSSSGRHSLGVSVFLFPPPPLPPCLPKCWSVLWLDSRIRTSCACRGWMPSSSTDSSRCHVSEATRPLLCV
jgi:hypothetical protein